MLGKNNKVAQAFVAESIKRGRPPTARNVFGYITLDRLPTAMNDAKSLDPVKVARAIEGVHFTSIFTGSGYYRKEEHQLMWPMWVAEIGPMERRATAHLIFRRDRHQSGAKSSSERSRKRGGASLATPAVDRMTQRSRAAALQRAVSRGVLRVRGDRTLADHEPDGHHQHGARQLHDARGHLAYTMSRNAEPFGWALIIGDPHRRRRRRVCGAGAGAPALQTRAVLQPADDIRALADGGGGVPPDLGTKRRTLLAASRARGRGRARFHEFPDLPYLHRGAVDRRSLPS